jgi:hypothetical protein
MIKIARKPNPAWKRYMLDRNVTTVPRPVVNRADRFFVMGSCFAEEIRLALSSRLGDASVGPDYRQARFDRQRAQIDNLPERNHLNTYNAYSILQEVERILGLWAPAAADFWHVDGRLQCPYRRMVFADTPATFAEIGAELDRVLREGFAAADHFIFTFGMTEVFINRASGKVANQKPGYGFGGGRDETDYHRASFAENLAVIGRIVDLIGLHKPEARVFVTVSPVPLKRTFSGEDIFVANSLSKSTLRAVLGELAAARENVTYFPSYEAVISGGDSAWQGDGRHVQRDVVEAITNAFVDAFLAADR